MDELITRLVDKVGINEDEARRAIGIIFGFIKDAGPPDKVDKLIALTAAGLSIQQIQGAAHEIIVYSKERAGNEPVDDVVRSISGLSDYV